MFVGGEWCSLDFLAAGCHTQDQIPKTEVRYYQEFPLLIIGVDTKNKIYIFGSLI
jgi:hypothetical protein